MITRVYAKTLVHKPLIDKGSQWVIYNATLDVAHDYKGYPWRWRVLKQTFCSDLPSRKYVR